MKRFGRGLKGTAQPDAPAPDAPPPPTDMTPAPAPIPDATPEKAGKDLPGRFNRFLQNAKPERILKGLRRADAPGSPGGYPSAPPVDPAVAAEAAQKAERRAAQLADYEQRMDSWNEELRRKRRDAELHDVPFDEVEDMPARPTPPPPAEDYDPDEPTSSDIVDGAPGSPMRPGMHQPAPQRASSFRPIEAPVVAEGQRASEVAEMFAAKAYGTQVHPAAASTSSLSSARSALFGAATRPMLPPGADPAATSAFAPMATAPPPLMPFAGAPTAPVPGMYAPAPVPPGAPAFAHAPSALGGGAPAPPGASLAAPPAQTRSLPLPQSVTYVDPSLAEHIRRGRELEKLAISEEERGNMGSANEAYMKALELLIPAIPKLDHGNDVSYMFRMSEKRKLNREAGLMLDRCEVIKRFLESEVAALNTRNLLDSAAVPQTRPTKMSELRTQRDQNDYDDDDDDDEGGGSSGGGLGLARKPVTKRRDEDAPPLVVPPPPPPPPPGLLDGFGSLTLSDPLVQQSHPHNAISPAPMPAALPRDRLHSDASPARMPPAARQQLLSRPPDGLALPTAPWLPPAPPAPPAPLLPTPPADADAKTGGALCEVCKTEPAKLVSKCEHNYCAQCMNKAATFQFCLHPDCHERVKSNDFRHILQ